MLVSALGWRSTSGEEKRPVSDGSRVCRGNDLHDCKIVYIIIIVGGFFTGSWTVKDCIPVQDEYFSRSFSSSTL